MEVNEEIIEQYLKLVKEWFYVRDISFPVARNYSNIDLLAFDAKRRRTTTWKSSIDCDLR
jgi:hypothetical protein